MTVSGRRRRVAVAAVVVGLVVATALPAGATGDGGASSRVTRDGRIITSILTGSRLRPRGSGRGPSSYWATVGDADLAELFRIFSLHPEWTDDPVIRELKRVIDGGLADDVTVETEVVDGRLTGRTRLVPIDASTPQLLARRMVTLLPSLPAVTSPPPIAPVAIGEPVFTSFEPSVWSTRVDRSLTVGAVTARVRAWPVSFLVAGGDPQDDRPRRCSGRSRPFDPTDPASPAAQARRQDTCASRYRTATGVKGRRDRWYGSITVVWHAEWTRDGTTWSSLGDIPQVSFFSRRVQSARTAIEAPS